MIVKHHHKKKKKRECKGDGGIIKIMFKRPHKQQNKKAP